MHFPDLCLNLLFPNIFECGVLRCVEETGADNTADTFNFFENDQIIIYRVQL